ncbi:DegV domain-containing protein [Peptococcaceae bacterium CEB3]|nr:DegV domain-containing protein [Peptococcaceae bacterium CEB3]
MEIKIVADSACDLNQELRAGGSIHLVPLRLTLGDRQYVDDETNIETFLADMRNSSCSPQTASPSPNEFMQNYEGAEYVFVVTLSSNISSTHNNAVLAREMVIEQEGHKFIHVFDSLSASIAETMVCLKIRELASGNLAYMEIVEKVTQYIREMKTIFLLDSLTNLMKSGRLNRVKGTLASLLDIKPILGASAEGTIDLFQKVRGTKKAFRRFVELIGEQGGKIEDKILGIAHCNCLDKAIEFKEEVLKRYHFKDIIIVEMGLTTSAYADEGGIIISF